MANKEKCKEFMSKCFGPATANMVDSMSDSEVAQKCREKIAGFLGEEKAKEFDAFVNS